MEFNEKQKLRHFIKEYFKTSFTSKDRKNFSKSICSRLISQSFYRNADTVMCYYPLSDEVDTTYICNDALKSGKKLLLPKCEPEKKIISPCLINNLTTDLTLGYAGITEPSAKKLIIDTKIDLILVPGRCFNSKGYRIGRGEGYYDRFLQNNLSSVKVGIAFEFQMIENILIDKHDISMDYIVTEKRKIDLTY